MNETWNEDAILITYIHFFTSFSWINYVSDSEFVWLLHSSLSFFLFFLLWKRKNHKKKIKWKNWQWISYINTCKKNLFSMVWDIFWKIQKKSSGFSARKTMDDCEGNQKIKKIYKIRRRMYFATDADTHIHKHTRTWKAGCIRSAHE